MNLQHQHAPQPEQRTSGGVALARLFWFALGPAALALLGYAIVSSGSGWATWLDAAFAGVACLMLAARWYELRSGQGQDSYGNPATTADFPKYARLAVPVALSWWVVANAIGNHLLNRGA